MQVEIYDISKSFGDRLLLDHVNASFNAGEVNVILGESGQGKTTLLNIIGLYEPADSGVVKFDGQAVSTLPKNQIRKIIRNQVAYIYQDIRLFDNLSVQENLNVALKFSAVPKSESKTRIAELLELVGLPNFAKSKVVQLSGGEKQRVAIARALVANKQLILADEPTGALDEGNAQNIAELLNRVATQTGATILLVTHSMKVANHFSTHFMLREKGLQMQRVNK